MAGRDMGNVSGEDSTLPLSLNQPRQAVKRGISMPVGELVEIVAGAILCGSIMVAAVVMLTIA